MNSVIIGLLSSLGSAFLIAIIFLVVYFFRYTVSGRIFLDRIGRPGEYDDEQAFAREEADALETMDDMQRTEYLRAKAFIQGNPPESVQTDISLSQYMAIQEKGVSAWEFEPELEIANCFVEARTEIEFFDSECTVMSNLPVPKQNEVYYWETKIYEKPENTLLSIGMATKPYPLFRLPGFHRYSVAYTSTGHRRYNQPFNPTNYALPFTQGDVIGVGYRPRTGTIFFTRNGKRLDDVVHGLKSQNFFPSIGANGPCVVHVNFGQAGFVFIEANVKKWGLAPMTGSLAPPPPYGSEQGSILLESGRKDGYMPSPAAARGLSQSYVPQVFRSSLTGRNSDITSTSTGVTGQQHQHQLQQQQQSHGRTRSGNFRILHPTSPGPQRSPTDISLTQLIPSDELGEASNAATSVGGPDSPHNHNHRSDRVVDVVGLGLHSSSHPPPEYSSPVHSSTEHSDDEGRESTETEGTSLIQARVGAAVAAGGRTRGATVQFQGHLQQQPPIPSYNDAIRQGAGRDRSRSDGALVAGRSS